MNALHTKAPYWVRNGVFGGLASFAELEARVIKIPEEKDRGDVFEIFVEGYLATQPITQWVRHWVVGNIPLSLRERYKLPRDATGIDGIYEMHDGSHVAYQVKFRQKRQLTFAEVAPFLGITEQFSDRVIFTNAATLSAKALQRTRWVSREAFLDLSANALRSIEAWLKQKPLPVARATPDPSYQVQALADIKATLERHDRATAVMACGTGKTLVALWAVEQARPKTVLVLVPSLTLLQQTLREWSEQTNWGSRFSYICVCSDKTVGLKNDALNTDTSEVGFRIDTDPRVVREFLRRQTTDVKVVFSTYQSSPVVGEGAKGLPPFDLAVFDEAHKTTGHAGTAFTFALWDRNIRIKKRLFLTATPRHIDIRHRDKEGEFRVQSMDDETVYGPRAHSLSFAVAAKKGIICPYKVIISLIDRQMVDDFTRRHGITIVKKDEIAARWVANLIAMQRAVEAVDAKKIISFHSRVRLAQEFASNESRGIAHYLRGYDVRHVNGAQSSGKRGEIIREFAHQAKSFLTNARCLTEGVNIPAVDMVAFIDPRQSHIDIAQAVGRAMRKPRGHTSKTVGYVVVPLFAGMGEKDNLDEAIKSENFKAVVDVLNALQEHDDDLVDIIREIRERKGEGKPFNPKLLSEKLEVIGPRIDLDRLTKSIGIEVADRIGTSWDEWYGLLVRFKAHEGHCRVPEKHVEGAFKLGSWVAHRRQARDTMSAERRQRLDAIGFEWDPLGTDWEKGFAALEKFRAREGHCRAPQGYVEEGFKLGQWVADQRSRRDIIPAEQRQRLDAIVFEWDPLTADWEKGFAVLEKFRAREGHCRAPNVHIEGGFKLGWWVGGQRGRRDTMPAERRQRLDAIGFVWDPFTAAWEKGFAALHKFKERERHCSAPQGYVEEGFKLGQWVSHQRKDKDTMSAEQRQRLDASGFDWDPNAARWEKGFAVLERFKAREGRCRVPRGYVEDGFKLGQWVSEQRKKANIISAERKQRLDAIEIDWDPNATRWEKGFTALEKFKARERHFRVPGGHSEGTFKLGSWVTNQRSIVDTMSPERKQQLDAIGFEWGVRTTVWEQGFAALEKFRARMRHCRVPRGHVEGAFNLGQWVSVQRGTKESMPTERKQRLDAIGFEWVPLTAAWEKGFSALEKFKAREGHWRVHKHHVEGAFKLGAWVGNLRNEKDTMSAERRHRLDTIGFDWDPTTTAWEKGFAALEKFKAREGHCRVPAKHIEGAFKLGTWVRNRRNEKDTISAERRQRLGVIGFEWDVFAHVWDKGFAALERFKAREGHCRAPAGHSERGFTLGTWVSMQRGSKATMPAERRHRLDAIGFVWRKK